MRRNTIPTIIPIPIISEIAAFLAKPATRNVRNDTAAALRA